MTLSSDRSATRRFNLRVFVAELLQFPGLARRHPAVDLLPAVERLLGDPDLATDIADRDAAFDLLQHGGDLLDGKALLLHGTPPGPTGRIMPQTSPQCGPKNPEPLTARVAVRMEAEARDRTDGAISGERPTFSRWRVWRQRFVGRIARATDLH